MDVQRPFIAKSKGSGVQLLRAAVNIDWKTGSGHCEFISVTPGGKKLTKHAGCQVNLVNFDEAVAEPQVQAVEILQRIVQLRKSIESNTRVQKMYGNTVYKLVPSLASYDEDFKGVEEVVLDSENLKVTAKVKFVWACDAIDRHITPHFERRPDDPEGLRFLTEPGRISGRVDGRRCYRRTASRSLLPTVQTTST
jgi:hypothetical protein